jgi:hypothetical protein
MEFLLIVCIALGLDCPFVPGATPKNPDSGLIADYFVRRLQIQAMSSPTVLTFQPSNFRRHQHRGGLPRRSGGAEIGFLATAECP